MLLVSYALAAGTRGRVRVAWRWWLRCRQGGGATWARHMRRCCTMELLGMALRSAAACRLRLGACVFACLLRRCGGFRRSVRLRGAASVTLDWSHRASSGLAAVLVEVWLMDLLGLGRRSPRAVLGRGEAV